MNIHYLFNKDFEDNADNYCYECGCPIKNNKHFCNRKCARQYFRNYYTEKEALTALANQTKARKKRKEKCFIKEEVEEDKNLPEMTMVELANKVIKDKKELNKFINKTLEIYGVKPKTTKKKFNKKLNS